MTDRSDEMPHGQSEQPGQSAQNDLAGSDGAARPNDTAPRQTLPHLPTGQRCRIQAVSGSGIMRHRLMDLGIFPNAEITLLRVAPLNDPIEIRVGHSFISLRRSEAELIEVVAL